MCSDSALKYEAQLKRPYDRAQFDLSWRTDPRWKSKGDWRDPEIIDVETFCQWLIGTLPTNVNSGIVPTSHLSSLRNRIANKKIHFDPFDSSKLRDDYSEFIMYYNLGLHQLDVDRLTEDQEEDLISLALDNLQVASGVQGATEYIQGRVKEVKTATFVTFYDFDGGSKGRRRPNISFWQCHCEVYLGLFGQVCRPAFGRPLPALGMEERCCWL